MAKCFDSNFAEVLHELFRIRHEGAGPRAWSPQIRKRYGYFMPDEWYEAVVFNLIEHGTDWLDVGCGRDLFPSNKELARILSSRCRMLVGVDPDGNIKENKSLHESFQCPIEEYTTEQQFDVVTLRMVAEHIVNPSITLSALSRVTRVGGRVVIYTVSKYSLVSLAAAVTPTAFHRWVRGLLWGSSSAEAFPTVFRMNTRAELRRLFSLQGFKEERFFYLNDCNTFSRWKWSAILELSVERVFRAFDMRYPEVCLLGIYRKENPAST